MFRLKLNSFFRFSKQPKPKEDISSVAKKIQDKLNEFN